MTAVAEGGPEAVAAERELLAMGGAALPHILPRLDALSPADRTRVAIALAPVGRRMGLGSEAETTTRETAALFWSRYWQDHAIDFRPAVVKRAVRRAADRPSPLRVAEVLSFDTFALSELIAEMRPLRSSEDVTRARRLAALASRLAPVAWTIDDHADLQRAKGVVDQWERWWNRSRHRYVPFQGAARIAAMLRETEYGSWVSELSSGSLGHVEDGTPIASLLLERTPTTAWLLAAGMLGGHGTGLLLGLVSFVWRRRVKRALGFVLVPAWAVLCALLASVVAPDAISLGTAMTACLLMTVLIAPAARRHARAAGIDTHGKRDLERTRAFGKPAWYAGRDLARTASVAIVGLVGVQLPLVSTAAFVVERALGLPGIGEPALEAVRSADVPFLMALVLLSTAAVVVVQVSADLLVGRIDPRVVSTWSPARGVSS
jgi:ABC-type dipeptide/oligopeptide/nickel transport system permease component